MHVNKGKPIVNIKTDYVRIPKKERAPSPTPDSPDSKDQERTELVRVHSPGLHSVQVRSNGSQACLAVPQKSSLLAGMVSDPAETIQQLQALVLAERGGSRINNNIKRFYTISTNTVANGTLTHILLNGISAGTSSNDRTSDVISQFRVSLNIVFQRSSGVSAPSTADPIVRWFLWRDKVPATPGTATATLSTGANPPSSNTDMYNRLGQAGLGFNSVAVRNPDTENRYHVYGAGHFKVQTKPSYLVATTPTVQRPPDHKELHQMSFDLRKVETTFADESTANPMLNAIFFSFFSDADYTSLNVTDVLNISSDLTFRDRQL